MVSTFSRSTSGHLARRSPSFSSPRVALPRKSWVMRSFSARVGVSLLLSLFFVISCGYVFVFPNLGQLINQRYGFSEFAGSVDGCDFFDGKWVPDNTHPHYNSSDCPFAERGFNCLANGRRDNEYLKWQWKPLHCDLPSFSAPEILEQLRGKRVVFVGDSMSRTQWESMICLLMTGVEDQKTVYEVNGNRITKQIRFLGVRFHSFNLTIEFYRSVFLVQQGKPPRHGPKRVQSTLHLDVLDEINKKWIDSDVLIFNSGQWWTPGKLFNVGAYFQVNGTLKLGMPINTAYRTALGTWASWVEAMVNTHRTQVFFRTFEPSHWGGPGRSVCKVTQYPTSETKGLNQSVFTDIISEVVSEMKVPVTILPVTSMGAFRSDAHVGKWSDNPSVPDCSHWCLPGVPDTWNELLFAYLQAKHRGSLR
ncbi:protein trichome berefringence-like 7 [Magnolia sinica]|uniref:protein trichome berefringence-like 7 n=1 Tax=Magnolia sinica TaxID=86752 RepID=UPI0026594926|nr:protein trichome berefringence-like 7 [Magnolia sinica]